MKITGDFMLREVAGQALVVPIGNSVVSVNAIITLSESAVILWRKLESGVESADELIEALLSEYDVDRETASQCTEEFLAQLNDKGMIE